MERWHEGNNDNLINNNRLGIDNNTMNDDDTNNYDRGRASCSHQISQKLSRWLSSTSMFGIREYTIEDHA